MMDVIIYLDGGEYLQYVVISNHHDVHIKHLQYYLSICPNKAAKKHPEGRINNVLK